MTRYILLSIVAFLLLIFTPQLLLAQEVEIRETLYFNTDEALIPEKEEAKLKKLLDTLERYDISEISLIGHTDTTGSDEYNLELSLNRAEAVRFAMIEDGIDKNKITISHKGRREPVAENVTKEGKAKNRRVDIIITGDRKPVAEAPAETSPPPPPPPAGKHLLLTGTVVDAVTGEALNARIMLTWRERDRIVKRDSVRTIDGRYQYSLTTDLPLEISAFSPGYVYQTKWAYPAQRQSNTMVVDFRLQPLRAGELFEAENLYFFPNTPELRPGSRPELDKLLQLLQDNPQLRIEIQGHVNWPSTYPGEIDAITVQLSEDRARTIYNFLVARSIAPERLSFKGLSNTRMVYPNASTQEEYIRNMRVEIMILEN